MVSGNLPGDSRALEIQIPCIVFFAVTPIFIAIRVWSRIQSRSGLGWDDWVIFASWVFAQTVSALMMASCAYGFGQHIKNLSVENKLMTLKLFYVAQAFYKLTINLTKASILLLYLRIFIQRWFRIACYVLLGIILSYMVATLASSIWQCTPIPRAWDWSIPGTCISIPKNWYANAGFSITTDILILLLPIQPIYTSKLPMNQKIALLVVFALGSFVTVTSILRMQTLNFSSTSPDRTFDIASSTWTIIEENVAIICACLPMCRKPLFYLFPSLSSSHKGSASSGYVSNSSNPQHSLKSGGTFKHAGTSRSDWSPYTENAESANKLDLDPRRVAMRTQVMRAGNDDSSEEYILSPVGRRGGPTTDGSEEDGTVIRKIMAYEVTYDNDEPKCNV